MQGKAGNKIAFGEINRLAIPALLAGLAEPIISLTDMAVVGNVREHSVEALAAAGIAGSFLSAMIWILAQTKTAISAIVSRHLGAGRLHAVKTLVPQTLVFNFLLSLLIGLTTAALAGTIFKLYNAEGLILDYAIDYYRIRAIGYPLTLVTFAIFGLFRGLQNTWWAMTCSLTGAAVNVGLDFLLVYGVQGLIPPLHLEGAAWASVGAQSLMLSMALCFYFRKTPFRLNIRKQINPLLKPLIIMSFHLFIRTLALNIAIYLGNAYATDYGKDAIAAHSILLNLWLFFAFFIDGYASAGNAMAGRLLGAKDYSRLWKLSIDSCKYALCIVLPLVLLCWLFQGSIGALFNKDQAVLRNFLSVFWILLLMQPVNVIAFVFDGIFKGLGEAVYLRNVLLVALVAGFLPVLLLGDHLNLGLHGIWLAFTVWMLIRAGALVLRFRKNYLQHA